MRLPGETDQEAIGRLSGTVDRLNQEVRSWKRRHKAAQLDALAQAGRVRALKRHLRELQRELNAARK